MKPPLACARLIASSLVWLVAMPDAMAQGTDPLSVVKAVFAAQNAGNVSAALALFADDAVLVNTREAKFTSKESIRKFIQANVDHKVRAEVQNLSPQIKRETVTLTDKYTTDFFERWGVGYVDFKTDVVVREGKIRSQINYITSDGLSKIERACNTPRGRAVVAGTRAMIFSAERRLRPRACFHRRAAPERWLIGHPQRV